MQRFSENIAAPDLLRVILKLLKQAHNQLLGLFFTSHNRAYLCGDVRAHHVDGWCRGFQPYSISSTLFYNLRFFQAQLFQRRHHDTISGRCDLLQSAFDLIILLFDAGKIAQTRQKTFFSADFQSGSFPKDIVKEVWLNGDGKHDLSMP